VYFIFDEFALLPQLSHIADGINFGRSLGLKSWPEPRTSTRSFTPTA